MAEKANADNLNDLPSSTEIPYKTVYSLSRDVISEV